MEVSIIFKIAAVGIVVSILNQILKHNGRDDQAALLHWQGFLLSYTGYYLIYLNCLLP